MRPLRAVVAKSALLVSIVLAAWSFAIASAKELDRETERAWDGYIQSAKSLMEQRAGGTSPFMWIDEAPGRRQAVQRGEILIEPTHKESPERLSHGLVYDWTGAMFIPHTTIRRIFKVLNEFDRYDEFYNPAVITAKLLADSGQSQRFSMVLQEKEPFVTTAFESEYLSQTTCLDGGHCFNIIHSTRVQQIENYDSPSELRLPPDQGYVWRLFSIQRFEERDGGVYTELEAIALGRDFPFEVRWLARPILQHLPRASMSATLQKTRDAVCAGEKPGRKDRGEPVQSAKSAPRL